MKRLVLLPLAAVIATVHFYRSGLLWPMLGTIRAVLRPEPCNEACNEADWPA